MLSQCLTGSLIRDPYKARKKDVAEIHGLGNPPIVKLRPEDINVRRCRLASDSIDSRFGRFRTEDLPHLLKLVQGAPVLIGHDRRSLGVARFYGGTVEERGDTTWIIPKFYWPRDHSQAEDLRIMIDGGVYNEASVAFIYDRPTCSICGQDLRNCSHWPGKKYEGELCFFWYDGVERVTEGSLVFRGATAGTGFELDEKSKSSPPLLSDCENRNPRLFRIKHRGRHYAGELHPAGNTTASRQ